MKYHRPWTIISIANGRSMSRTITTRKAAWTYLKQHLGNSNYYRPGFHAIGTSKHSIFVPHHARGPMAKQAWFDKRMERRADGRARVLGYPAESPQWKMYCEAYAEHERWIRRFGPRLTPWTAARVESFEAWKAKKRGISI